MSHEVTSSLGRVSSDDMDAESEAEFLTVSFLEPGSCQETRSVSW